MLNDKFNSILPRGRSQTETVIGKDGTKIPIRRVPQKNEYWNIQKDQVGEGC